MSLVVLHAGGEPEGGLRWRDALAGAGVAPDLPGHGAAPAPIGGCYDPTDPVYAVLPLIDVDHLPVVIGHDTSAHAATLLAVGGRAAALVIVDGLGGTDGGSDAAMAAFVEWLHAIADDPAAMAPAPASGLDPRAAHGFPPLVHDGFDARLRSEVTVPVLLLESPATPTSAEDLVARATTFGGPVTVERVADAAPATVIEAVETWLAGGRVALAP
jgi:pimeloyl-ACP methyl ester carboxylesterase